LIEVISEIEQFYLNYRPLSDSEILNDAILKHISYGTITVLHDSIGISGLVRFNVNGECAHVLDLIVRKDMERKGMIKQLIIHSWHKFPYLRFFRLERALKYPKRPPKAYSLSKFMKGK
jgi:hypothetical protein